MTALVASLRLPCVMTFGLIVEYVANWKLEHFEPSFMDPWSLLTPVGRGSFVKWPDPICHSTLPARFRCQIYHSFNQGKKRQIRERAGDLVFFSALYLKLGNACLVKGKFRLVIVLPSISSSPPCWDQVGFKWVVYLINTWIRRRAAPVGR